MANFPPVRRISIFVGNLGSRKTELAINFALGLAGAGRWVALVDLDVINPYYRTRYVKQRLESLAGLEVVCPAGELLQADVPALSPAIYGVFADVERWGVFDVGGDDVGSTVLGRFRPHLPVGDSVAFFVVNSFRPRTNTVEKVIKMVRDIERAARVSIDYLVNNANLGSETEPAMVAEGHNLVLKAASELGCGIAFTAARQDLATGVQELLPGVPVLPLQRFMLPPWERSEE
ncbi:MAG: hypothetical protein M0028_06835 [Clostridia bacterium]|nr:hypothetical protein [Clostridia bacterium]